MTTFEKLLDVLMRPVYGSAGAASEWSRGRNPIEGAWRGLVAEDRKTYSDVLSEMGMAPGLGRGALGFGLDIALDPTTYLTFGAGAGARVGVGGATKVLSKAAQAARVGALEKKTAQAARLMAKAPGGAGQFVFPYKLGDTGVEVGEAVSRLKPEKLERLLYKLDPTLPSIAARMTPEVKAELLPKLMASAAVSKGLGRVAEGKATGWALKSLEGMKGEEIFKPAALRFMGAPLIKGETIAKPFKALGKAYLKAEGLPVVGKALGKVHEVVSTVGKAAKAVFSTKTPWPEFDRIMRANRHLLDTDSTAMLNAYRDEVIPRLDKLRKESPEHYEGARKLVTQMLEDVVNIDLAKLAPAERMAKLDESLKRLIPQLDEALQEAVEGTVTVKKPGFFTKYVTEKLGRTKDAERILRRFTTEKEQLAARVQAGKEALTSGEVESRALEALEKKEPLLERETMRIARKMAEEAKAGLNENYAQYKEMLGRLRESKVHPSAGIAAEDFAAAVPKSMRSNKRQMGLALDEVADELKRRGILAPDAGDEDALRWIREGVEAEKQLREVRYTKKALEKYLPTARQAAAENVFRTVVYTTRLGFENHLESLSKEMDVLLPEYEKRLSSIAQHRLGYTRPEYEAAGLTPETIASGLTKEIDKLKAELATTYKTYATVPSELVDRVRVVEAAIVAVRKEMSVPFVHPLVRDIAVFIKGRMRQVWEAEQKWLALPPELKRAYAAHIMTPEARAMMVEMLRQGDWKILRPEFSQRLGSSQRRTFEGGVDELTFANMVDSGAFDPAKVKEELGKRGMHLSADDLLVFEQDPIKAAAQRELRSIRARSAAELAKAVMESPFFGKAKVKLGDIQTIRSVLEQHGPGHAIYVPTKEWIDRFATAEERRLMRLGEQKGLVGSLFQSMEYSDLVRRVDTEAKAGATAYILPREVAEHLSKAYSYQTSDEAIKGFVAMWDSAGSWWKSFATVVRPQFHIRNAFSNVWQAFLGGVRDPRVFFSAGILQNNPEALANVGRYSGKEVAEMATMYGVTRHGFFGAEIGEAIERSLDPSKNPLSRTGPLARWGTKVGTAIEDNARLAMFIDGIQKGMDPAEAALNVKKFLFDYSDLTRTERMVLRRVLPFYTWTRFSIPLALETIVTKPAAVSALGKVQAAGEKNVEDVLERKYVAKWIREGLGIPFRKGADGKTEYFLLKGFVPTADLAKLDVDQVLSMLHPAIKTPIEQAVNRQLFSGKPIERFTGERVEMMGVPIPGRVAHVLRNMVTLQELDRMVFQPGMGVSRRGGLPIYGQDKLLQMKAALYDLQKRMGELDNSREAAAKKYGEDSTVAKQYDSEILDATQERDALKRDILSINPDAFKRQDGDVQMLLPKQGKPLQAPKTLQGVKARLNIDRLLVPKRDQK